MSDHIKVWDILVRTFHWALVFFFTFSYLTGGEETPLHMYSGYIIIGLLLVRILWGLAGSRHARFSDFIYSPAKVIGYLKGLFNGKASRYLGHNPAGGWMVIALMLSILSTTGSGLLVYGLEGHGPLASIDNSSVFVTSVQGLAEAESGHRENKEDEEKHNREIARVGAEAENPAVEAAQDVWKEVHELFANFTVLLVVLHILGVLVSSRAHKENLVKAMITGFKHK